MSPLKLITSNSYFFSGRQYAKDSTRALQERRTASCNSESSDRSTILNNILVYVFHRPYPISSLAFLSCIQDKALSCYSLNTLWVYSIKEHFQSYIYTNSNINFSISKEGKAIVVFNQIAWQSSSLRKK